MLASRQPTADFVCFCEHPHFKLLVENRPEIPENEVVPNHLFTLHTVREDPEAAFQHFTS
jgi:hypothetical protein